MMSATLNTVVLCLLFAVHINNSQETHKSFKYSKFSNNAYHNKSTAMPCIAENSDLENAGINHVLETSNCTSLSRDEYYSLSQSNIFNTISMYKEIARYRYQGAPRTARSIFVPGNVATGAEFRYVINVTDPREFDLSVYNKDSTNRMLRMSVTGSATEFNTKDGSYGSPEYATTHAFTNEGVYEITFVIETGSIVIYIDGTLNHQYQARVSSSLITQTIFQGNNNCQILEVEIDLTEP